MYSSFQAVWDGLTRALYSVSSISMIALLGLLAAGYICFLGPFYWLFKMIFFSSLTPVWGPLVTLQVSFLFITRRWVDVRFKESLLSTFLYPLGIAFIIAVVLNGVARRLSGIGVSWKKRTYDKGSAVN
jgi:hypothetical protein